MLGLPTGYDGQIRVIEIKCDSTEIPGPHVFYMLLDELEKELNVKNKAIIHYREFLLHAYTEGRLFGLSVEDDKTSFNIQPRDTDNLFMAGTQNLRILPCFCIADAYDSTTEPAVDFIWTAIRAREMGMATYLLDCLGITHVHDPEDEKHGFWAKYCASFTTQSELSPICRPRIDTGHRAARSSMSSSLFSEDHAVTTGVEV